MKSKRHAEILELIDKYDIETQEELAEHLNESGFSVTQATISRDIRELKLSKVSGSNGRQKYTAFIKPSTEMTDKYSRVLKEGYVSKEVATSMIVIKTVTGMAMAVAVAIDHMELPGVVGCIAGDDTIMCALRSREDAHLVMEKISEMLR
ncbi:MAG: arginine repressor [Clostridia bacterium]|nr:arginine repressor [Lachnospiraceae bacterium]NCC00256.1 arginine repressor [Clostridia bacterium]NCD02280.1 arginine repressor [Clostridia bacterium]